MSAIRSAAIRSMRRWVSASSAAIDSAASTSRRGVSPQQVCLAGHLAQSPVVVPIPGARRPASVRDPAGAAGLMVSASEMAGLHL
ncbi:aldo/keto reductase [Streptomyces parvus]|uniref:aldo/keto reductase n=1 Tax=Streptomyces parvus TaxID=66428 RepID=UPI003826EA1B